MEREMKLFVTGPRPLEKREEVSQYRIVFS